MPTTTFNPGRVQTAVLESLAERHRREWRLAGIAHSDDATGEALLRQLAAIPSPHSARYATRLGSGCKAIPARPLPVEP